MKPDPTQFVVIANETRRTYDKVIVVNLGLSQAEEDPTQKKKNPFKLLGEAHLLQPLRNECCSTNDNLLSSRETRSDHFDFNML